MISAADQSRPSRLPRVPEIAPEPVRRSRVPNRMYLRWAARNAEPAALIVAGLLAFHVIPAVPGIRPPEGSTEHFQGEILFAAVLLIRRGYRIGRWVRKRRRTHRIRRRVA